MLQERGWVVSVGGDNEGQRQLCGSRCLASLRSAGWRGLRLYCTYGVVGLVGLEPTISPLWAVRFNQLNYKPRISLHAIRSLREEQTERGGPCSICFFFFPGMKNWINTRKEASGPFAKKTAGTLSGSQRFKRAEALYLLAMPAVRL